MLSETRFYDGEMNKSPEKTPRGSKVDDDKNESMSSCRGFSSLDNSMVETKFNSTLKHEEADSSSKVGDPPPLPPKPKVLPIKPSNWGQTVFKMPREIPKNDRAKHTLYLEQPTSSFV